MSSLLDKSKIFLNKHSHTIDFVSASFIISLCLIILLPKVHESFQQVSSNSPHQFDNSNYEEQSIIEMNHVTNDNSPHQHNHNHKLPIGELLICSGFFVFYCIGLSLNKTNYRGERQPLLLAKRKVNKYYVEEIRITRRHVDDNSSDTSQRQKTNFNTNDPNWPLSAKVTLFALIFACGLIIFDINIHGLMETIKVFRAAATGALLYLAFFVILPKTPDCNFCTKSNEDDEFLNRNVFAQQAH